MLVCKLLSSFVLTCTREWQKKYDFWCNLTSSDDSFAQTVGRVDFAPNGFLRIVRNAFSFPKWVSACCQKCF
ncbi:hypothetical protein EVA_09442 [gut metagenome]|uniref:Uncharacterized protein n=1 Tax=gut metagenome TaxID=749906 RepID=J9CQM1_9ZZZZ